MEDFDEMRASTRVLRQVPSRRASQAATKPSGGSSKLSKKLDDDSSSESSDVRQLTVVRFVTCGLCCALFLFFCCKIKLFKVRMKLYKKVLNIDYLNYQQ